MKHAATFTIMAAGLMFGPAFAEAAPTQRIGSTVQVVNEVSAAYEQDRRDLTLGDEIHQDELIEVGPDSIGELEFADETKMALGPGSQILLDKFVYNGAKTKGDIAVELVKGAFRFITGVATKPSYRIKTPGAAITVRGTIFDVYVLTDNSAWFLLLEGGITACNDTGTCKDLSQPGSLLRVSPDGEISDPMRWALLPGRDEVGFARAFPFMINAPTINPNPPLTREAVLSDEPAPKKKSTPKKSNKKKAEKTPKPKPKKKVTEKKTYDPEASKPKRKKVVVKKRRKKSREARNSGASDAAKAAIAIGIGIGIGKMIGKNKGGRKECMRVGGCGGKVGGGHKRGGGRKGGHSDYMRY
ncbi:MAG: FecR domain-containing protein [Alphaproteobacteria bacterium]|nr:FecR domain-containing protein [Alphaproteobacteria bacterium]